jgi:membrane-associated phospholipid phosphatase
MALDDSDWLLQADTLIPGPMSAWELYSRLGEAQILLPAMAAALFWLLRTPRGRPMAVTWCAAVLMAALLTTATKVAFIGWEVGYAPLDYSGFSGHSMFAAAVLPVLMRIAAGRARRPWPRLAIATGYLLALLIAISRVKTGAHSVADIVPGFLLGALASAAALRGSRMPQAPTPVWVGAALLVWLVVLPLGAPISRTHDYVTKLALKLSGRASPYTLQDMRRAQAAQPHSLHIARQRLPAGQMQGDPALKRQISGHGVR